MSVTAPPTYQTDPFSFSLAAHGLIALLLAGPSYPPILHFFQSAVLLLLCHLCPSILQSVHSLYHLILILWLFEAQNEVNKKQKSEWKDSMRPCFSLYLGR